MRRDHIGLVADQLGAGAEGALFGDLAVVATVIENLAVRRNVESGNLCANIGIGTLTSVKEERVGVVFASADGELALVAKCVDRSGHRGADRVPDRWAHLVAVLVVLWDTGAILAALAIVENTKHSWMAATLDSVEMAAA